MQIVNQLSLETPAGYRQISLVHGDISKADCDLVVLSSHANRNYTPFGATLDAFADAYDLEALALQPLLTLHNSIVGTYATEWDPKNPDVATLVTRLPAANRDIPDEKVSSFYDEVVWTLFGSLAAEELKGHEYGSIGIPLIGGQRGYDQLSSMKSIIRYATRWLYRSSGTDSVRLFAYEDESVDQWSMAMDESLGRRLVDTATDQATDALRDEVLALLDCPSSKELLDEKEVREPLARALRGRKQQVCVQNIGTFGRKLVEQIVHRVLVESGREPVHSLYENIEQRLRQSSVAAPWIVNHCHTLRTFGNESVHARDERDYIPKMLDKHDLVALLSSMLRVLQFAEEWWSQQ